MCDFDVASLRIFLSALVLNELLSRLTVLAALRFEPPSGRNCVSFLLWGLLPAVWFAALPLTRFFDELDPVPVSAPALLLVLLGALAVMAVDAASADKMPNGSFGRAILFAAVFVLFASAVGLGVVLAGPWAAWTFLAAVAAARSISFFRALRKISMKEAAA